MSPPQQPALQLDHCSFREFQTEIAQVRQAVFQEEQGIDSALDEDGQDDHCYHWIASINQTPIGVARLRPLSATTAKLERVAVLKPWRRKGIGQALVQAAIAFAQTQGIQVLYLHAQSPTVPFYETLGFRTTGAPFPEAGIVHFKMSRTVS